MSFWCFNASGRDLSHNTSLTSEKSSLRKYNISKSTDLPRCLYHAASLSLWPCVWSKGETCWRNRVKRKKDRQKPTYRYFQTTSSCLNDFLRVYKHFRLLFVCETTPSCGYFRRRFKHVHHMALEKVEISYWKRTWKRWKTPMQIKSWISIDYKIPVNHFLKGLMWSIEWNLSCKQKIWLFCGSVKLLQLLSKRSTATFY